MIPGGRRLHGSAQPLVRLRRRVEAGQKRRIGFRTDHEHGTVEQGVFSGATRCVQDEIGTVRAACTRSAVDQVALLGLDADV